MDRVTKFLAHEGRVNIICADTTNLIEEIRKLHDLTPTTTAALGRFATMSGMMGLTELKQENEKISIQMNGKGPVGNLYSIIKRDCDISKIKVCIDNPIVELPLKENGKLDVGGAVGKNGFLNIQKQNTTTDTDYNGLISLVSGEIAEDFTEYFAKSKQIPTVVALGVLVDKSGVKKAGGYVLQLMPDATEQDIEKIEKALEKAPSITTMLSEGKSLEEIVRIITGDNDILVLANDPQIVYECDCNKTKFEKGIISLGKEEIEKMIKEDGNAHVKCHFCNKEFNFTKQELEEILDKI